VKCYENNSENKIHYQTDLADYFQKISVQIFLSMIDIIPDLEGLIEIG
jgi:hypothetical protein